MRDPARIENFCNQLKLLWLQHPELRFGQIVSNAIPEDCLFYVEDDVALDRIKTSFESIQNERN